MRNSHNRRASPVASGVQGSASGLAGVRDFRDPSIKNDPFGSCDNGAGNLSVPVAGRAMADAAPFGCLSLVPRLAAIGLGTRDSRAHQICLDEPFRT